MVKSHTHEMDHTHATVPHTHSRGSMEITGYMDFWTSVGSSLGLIGNTSGAIRRGSKTSPVYTIPDSWPSAYSDARYEFDFAASRSWGGVTSSESPNTYGASRNYTSSNNANANENRPENFTIKIWKRTA